MLSLVGTNYMSISDLGIYVCGLFHSLLLQHHYLFWERMVPEWGLAVFMKLFKLNREDALDHLRKQEMLIDSTTSFDIS